MDNSTNITARSKAATLAALEPVTSKFEDEGALLSIVDSTRHLSAILCNTLERTFHQRQEQGENYVRITFSEIEIERILWMATELSECGHRLNKASDAAYSALIELGA